MFARLSKNPDFLRLFRLALLFLTVFYTFLTIAFIQRWSFTRDLWPWTGTYSSLNGLSSIFIASIAAATAGSLFWTVWTGEVAGAAGGGIDLLFTFGGSGIFLLQDYLAMGSSRSLIASVICLLIAIGSIIVFWTGNQIPFKDPRPQPLLVRRSFMFFIFLLLAVGTILILKIEDVFPWNISVQASVVYGWIFIGAGLYFSYSLVRTGWANTGGQLAGFLAYDLVLIYPFLTYLSRVPDHLRFALLLYIGTLVYSGIMAIYYLFFNPKTRFQRTQTIEQRQPVVEPSL
ncbi:MAG TPA: hypothetical protein VHL11_25385, partial [Phototrophicaceae bacterium]|jgi:hypothetical protein|nr:hypothetical protein [Phototrophicaceae bacterium]